MHTHTHDYVFYAIEGSTGEVSDKDGNVFANIEMNEGDTMFFRLEGEELVSGDLRVPATHNARNVGATRYREIPLLKK